jgi:hypothetical protein
MRISHGCAREGMGKGGEGECMCVTVGERGEFPRYNIPVYR